MLINHVIKQIFQHPVPHSLGSLTWYYHHNTFKYWFFSFEEWILHIKLQWKSGTLDLLQLRNVFLPPSPSGHLH
jgi:hypothetical protein